MKTMKTTKTNLLLRLTALLLALCLLPVLALGEATETTEMAEAAIEAAETVQEEAAEEAPEALADTPLSDLNTHDWINFLLICNEGMNNDGGNAGNTLGVIALNADLGKIRVMMFTWDTFIDYEGFDVPQRIDMPYRNNGPQETMKVFDDNFGLDINLYLSLNYLNLASLIDTYGGVTVDISRAERNALNGMVASKTRTLKDQVAAGLLSQAVIDMLASEYNLQDFGPETHLNGLQAVGYGWLQYDSVYNCCLRDAKVITALFKNVSQSIADKVVFYKEEGEKPEDPGAKRVININAITEDDFAFLRREVAPIFEMSANNLTEEDIHDITIALTHVAYEGARQGVDIFNDLDYTVFPLEAKNEYDIIAGAKGHLVDKEANIQAMTEFLYSDPAEKE